MSGFYFVKKLPTTSDAIALVEKRAQFDLMENKWDNSNVINNVLKSERIKALEYLKEALDIGE
ncbi:MAG: hypothetical protein CVU85_00375 [Firmicutes bacterium HGW-Firmicutes-10]|jgi:hypothetical protein|nr:MAG: hypothetical protein CVU85_00375 [Firmicutes bacterium HGW-Firmicutes-10]